MDIWLIEAVARYYTTYNNSRTEKRYLSANPSVNLSILNKITVASPQIIRIGTFRCDKRFKTDFKN